MENERNQIDISAFVELRKKELGLTESDDLAKLDICSQSIARWGQYCQYHHYILLGTLTEKDLSLDSKFEYRRAGENVCLRYVYEANIAAFIQSLHALLDSFPYLLNLFYKEIPDSESTKVKWSLEFINKYKNYEFYNDLIGFMLEEKFNKIKGYCNTIKHKHLVRISNSGSHLEFENFSFKQPIEKQQGKYEFEVKVLSGQNALDFVQECHNELIPKFFSLCQKLIDFKKNHIEKKL